MISSLNCPSRPEQVFKLFMGSRWVIAQNQLPSLGYKNSVLTKMPRDYTALLNLFSSTLMYSPRCSGHPMPSKSKTRASRRKLIVTLPNTTNQQPMKQASRRRRRNRRRRAQAGRANAPSLTPAGAGFLKCTLAPADFTRGGSGFQGIPDEYDGETVQKEWYSVTSFPAYTAGQDVYIIQMPVPGVAYFWGSRAAGTTGTMILNPVVYPNAGTFFPKGSESTQATAFRYASNVIEIVPTVNDMTWAGSMQVWKDKIEPTTNYTTVSGVVPLVDFYALTGFATLAASEPTAVFAFKDGMYAPGFNSDANYEWTPVMSNFGFSTLNTNQSQVPVVQDNVIGFPTTTTPIFYVGIGSFETTIIKLPALPSGQTAVIRAWSCQEYQVSPYSLLYDFARMSPAYDPMALALLKEYHKRVPTAVCCKDNANFWETFIKFLRGASRVASYLPGPVGLIGSGVGELLDTGTGLF